MLEIVNSGLYFVQDENNFMIGSGSVSGEKSTGSGGPEINGSDRIWILIPDYAMDCGAISTVCEIS